jgi:hypothetical protein
MQPTSFFKLSFLNLKFNTLRLNGKFLSSMTCCQSLAYPNDLTVTQHRALNYRNIPNTPLNKEFAIAPHAVIGSLLSLKAYGAQSDDGSLRQYRQSSCNLTNR